MICVFNVSGGFKRDAHISPSHGVHKYEYPPLILTLLKRPDSFKSTTFIQMQLWERKKERKKERNDNDGEEEIREQSRRWEEKEV